MFNLMRLSNAFNDALQVVNYKGGFDTFKFRKSFESDFDLSSEEKEEIMAYVKSKIQKANPTYWIIKNQIDSQEFLSTDYYANPYPRNFRGAYSSVIYKTFAGVMALSLS